MNLLQTRLTDRQKKGLMGRRWAGLTLPCEDGDTRAKASSKSECIC